MARPGSSRPRLRVAQHQPWRRAALVLVLLGEKKAGFARDSADSEMRAAIDQVQTLLDRNNELVEDNAVLRQAAEVEKIAHAEIRRALLAAEQEVSELRQELVFYRNLMSPGDTRAGLHVEAATLGPDLLPDTYRYELVLTQVRGKNRFASGQLLVKISGHQGREPTLLTLADVTPDGDASLKFRFKYFQMFSGQLTLPSGFKPDSIEFEAVSAVKGLDSVSRRFDWQELIAGGTEINVGQD